MDYREYKKAFSKLGWFYTIGSILVLIVQAVTTVIVEKVNPALLEDMNWNLFFSVVPMYLIAMPIMVLLVSKLPGQEPERHKMKVGAFVLAMIMCFALMYTSNLVGTMITMIIGVLKGTPVNNDLIEVATNTNLLTNFIYMVILAPILEELIFRKLIVDKTRRYGEGIAILLSGLMFGLFHGNLSQFMYACVIGFLFAFIYVRTGNIKISILMHAIINFMGSILAVLLMRAIDYKALMELTNAEVYDEVAAMELVMDNLLGWLVYFAYVILLLGLTIAGVVLLIVFRKRFVLRPSEIVLEKGKKFSTVFLNSGMIAFFLYWVASIVLQLFE